MRYYPDFSTAIREAHRQLRVYGTDVDPGRWQGVPTEGKPDLMTRELLNWGMSVNCPDNLTMLREDVAPNLPWADAHFAERVGRVPSNPGDAYERWPWWRGQFDVTASTMGNDPNADEFRFTHTYQERFWPKRAGDSPYPQEKLRTMYGIRYEYGDLDDLVELLMRDPYTRQAYLPIFFPEDTGAVHEGRIPCTLGYQFLLRDGKLQMWYFIRSCDYIRHFRDDIYLAARLQLWVLDELRERELRGSEPQVWFDVDPGWFNMLICSLHYHRGDEHLIS